MSTPYFYVYPSADQSLTSGVAANITWGVQSANEDLWDPLGEDSEEFTVPSSGLYAITASVNFYCHGNDATYALASIQVSGTTTCVQSAEPVTGTNCVVPLSYTGYLEEGEVIRFRAQMNGTTPELQSQTIAGAARIDKRHPDVA